MSKILTEEIIPNLKAQVVTKAEFEAAIGDIETNYVSKREFYEEVGGVNASLIRLDTGEGVA